VLAHDARVSARESRIVFLIESPLIKSGKHRLFNYGMRGIEGKETKNLPLERRVLSSKIEKQEGNQIKEAPGKLMPLFI
jgi:hypothetical protein